MTKKEAWAALDAARIPAWRHWTATFRHYKSIGTPFDIAFNLCTDLLLKNLEPYYKAVEEAE